VVEALHKVGRRGRLLAALAEQRPVFTLVAVNEPARSLKVGWNKEFRHD
jgi:hypothetical protein